MDLNNISEVTELNSIIEVNKKLTEGWILINTYTTAPFPDTPGHQISMFVLGLSLKNSVTDDN